MPATKARYDCCSKHMAMSAFSLLTIAGGDEVQMLPALSVPCFRRGPSPPPVTPHGGGSSASGDSESGKSSGGGGSSGGLSGWGIFGIVLGVILVGAAGLLRAQISVHT